MASPYFGGSSSGGGSPYFGGDKSSRSKASAPAKKSGGGGILGALKKYSGAELVGNAAKDVGQTAIGIGPGIYNVGKAAALDFRDQALHPGRQQKARLLNEVATPIAKGYKDYYGHDVAHHIYQHPLQPALDALTVATAGAAGAAKVGSAAAKVSETSKLAKLGKLGERGTVETRSPRRIATGKGPTHTDLTSHRPLIKLREQTSARIRSNPSRVEKRGGELQQYGKQIQAEAGQHALQRLQHFEPYHQATKRLSANEWTALHIRAMDIHPDDLAELWKGTPAAKAVTDGRIRSLVLSPSKRMLRAEPEARKMSQAGERLYKQQRLLKDATAEARPDLTKRQASELLGRPVRTVHGEPYYFPHTIEPPTSVSPLAASGGGKAVPRKLGSTKENTGALALHGKLHLRSDVLGPEFLRRVKYVKYDEIHNALRRGAVRVTRQDIEQRFGGKLPKGWEYLRQKQSTRIPPTLRAEGDTHIPIRQIGEARRGNGVPAETGLLSREQFIANRPKPSPHDEPPTVEALAAALRQRHGKPGITIENAYYHGLQAESPAEKLVVYRDAAGEPVGVLSIHRHIPDAAKAMPLGDAAALEQHLGPPELLSVAVKESHRRQGIATKLYDAAKQAGYDVEAASGKGGYTEEGAALAYSRLRKAPPKSAAGTASSPDLSKLIPNPDDLHDSQLAKEGFSTTDPAQAHASGEHYYIVPKTTVRAATGEFSRSSDFTHAFVKRPLMVWRAAVLGLRVGFLTNNLVGNSIMYAAKTGGQGAIRDLFGAIVESHGRDVAKRVLDDPATPPKLRGDLYKQYFPEQIQGTFGRTQSPATSQTHLTGQKAVEVGRAVTGAIPRVTSKVAEEYPRRALIRHYVRHSPEFRAVYQTLPKQTRTFETAARRVLEGEGPRYQRYISKQVNQALGDYLNLSPFERNVMRNALPFYSWYRAIVQTTYHLAVDTPGRALALQQIGKLGKDQSDKALGEVPSFLKGSIPLGPGKDGTRKVLATQSLNPYATLEQVGRGVGQDYTSLGLNPFVEGPLQYMQYHRGNVSPLTLALSPLKDLVANLPPSRLLAPPGPSKLYPTRKGRGAQVPGYLGVPVKEYDPNIAAEQAKQGR